jgi:excisionase family DNA binding protein
MRTDGNPERLTLTVDEAGRKLGLSRMAAYAAAKNGQIPTLRIGRRILVPRVAFERLLDNTTQ